MRRRDLLLTGLAAAGCRAAPARAPKAERRIAITVDDPTTDEFLVPVETVSDGILRALGAHRVSAMLFVCGMRVDSPKGLQLLSSWNDAGHALGNHSYAHRNFNDPSVRAADLVADLERCEGILRGFTGFRRRFRYPFLKEGETREKRDEVRAALRARQYSIGHVTVDTSDWAYDQRLLARFRRDPRADLAPFRAAYLAHMLDRARYYDRLATEVIGRRIPHVILMHHNLVNSLFLGDLLDALTREDWTIVSAEDAFLDPIFATEPNSLPSGESLVWALAQSNARFRGKLRYPGEDEVYEVEALDRLEPATRDGLQ